MGDIGGRADEPVPFAAIATLVVIVVVTIAVAVSAVGRDPARTRKASRAEQPPSGGRPNAGDHWHAALGVNDCGRWVPNWLWPPGTTATGGNARAGTHGTEYAGL